MALAPPGGYGAAGGWSLPPALSLGELYKQQTRAPGKPVPLAKKGAPWSDEEHKAFLAGLKMYGRGQWKQISRYYVPSRTPTQVASHAQKHFLRQSGAQKRRSRFSAVEEAAAAASLAPPLPLPGLALPAGMASPHFGGAAAGAGTPVPGVPGGMPVLFAHQPTTAPAAHLPPRPSVAGPSPGSLVGGIAMGVPIGVLPPLPSITTASGTELPILPVMPGRINALAASAPTPPPAAATATTSYSGESSGSERRSSRPPSPAPEGGSLHARAAAPPGRGGRYTPARAQQLLRLLELNEQMAGGGGGSGGMEVGAGAGASTGSAPLARQPSAQAPSQQHSSMARIPSATAALDALAALAEAEAESEAASPPATAAPAPAAAAPAPGAAPAAAPASQPQPALVSAC